MRSPLQKAQQECAWLANFTIQPIRTGTLKYLALSPETIALIEEHNDNLAKIKLAIKEDYTKQRNLAKIKKQFDGK